MDEPIAIVGVDARLPGDGDTAESFYESLLAGRSARSEIPPERFAIDSFWHPEAERSGSVSFLPWLVAWPNHYHWLTQRRPGQDTHISSKEVLQLSMRPFSLLRLLRPMGWIPSRGGCWNLSTRHSRMVSHVITPRYLDFNTSSAGIPVPKAAGSQTGVYVGCFAYDYNDIIVKDLDLPSKYAATGTVASMLSNRVSWFFDFRGPSITVDTACSSSLVAAHEACMSLKLREIDMVSEIVAWNLDRPC